jgi:ABC-type branched-subunit amino acid transport system substrate-binding protein
LPKNHDFRKNNKKGGNRMNLRKVFCIPAIILMVCFFVTAGNGYSIERGFDDREIRIGQFGPQTGPAATWGAVARGSKLLFDLVNEEGGIHGRKIRYFIRDDHYSPSQAMAAVRELVDRQGIFAFTGGVSGAGCHAVKGYIEQNKILWVTLGSAALNPVDDPPSLYRFHAYPLFQDEASIMTKFAVEDLGFKKIGFLYQNDSFGKAGLAGCKQRIATYKDAALVAELPVEATAADLSSQILRLRKADVDTIFMWVNPTLAVMALKTAASIDYKPQWIAFNGLSEYPLMYKITDGLFEGVITSTFVAAHDSTDPLVVKYREAAKRLAPEDRWGMLFIGGIFFSEPLVEALKRAGRDLSTEKVINELNKFDNWKGVGAPITWNKNRRQGTDSVMITQCGPGGSQKVLKDWTANELATWKKK